MSDKLKDINYPTIAMTPEDIRWGVNFPRAKDVADSVQTEITPSDMLTLISNARMVGNTSVGSYEASRMGDYGGKNPALSAVFEHVLQQGGYTVIVNIDSNPNRTNWTVDWSGKCE